MIAPPTGHPGSYPERLLHKSHDLDGRGKGSLRLRHRLPACAKGNNPGAVRIESALESRFRL
jgi:hypothetical protein